MILKRSIYLHTVANFPAVNICLQCLQNNEEACSCCRGASHKLHDSRKLDKATNACGCPSQQTTMALPTSPYSTAPWLARIPAFTSCYENLTEMETKEPRTTPQLLGTPYFIISKTNSKRALKTRGTVGCYVKALESIVGSQQYFTFTPGKLLQSLN